jgi:hypothetical protein
MPTKKTKTANNASKKLRCRLMVPICSENLPGQRTSELRCDIWSLVDWLWLTIQHHELSLASWAAMPRYIVFAVRLEWFDLTFTALPLVAVRSVGGCHLPCVAPGNFCPEAKDVQNAAWSRRLFAQTSALFTSEAWALEEETPRKSMEIALEEGLARIYHNSHQLISTPRVTHCNPLLGSAWMANLTYTVLVISSHLVCYISRCSSRDHEIGQVAILEDLHHSTMAWASRTKAMYIWICTGAELLTESLFNQIHPYILAFTFPAFMRSIRFQL